jgi:polysaccharide export outer membrane protein
MTNTHMPSPPQSPCRRLGGTGTLFLSVVVLAFAFSVLAAPARAQSAGDYVIGPQDVLTIALFDQPDLNGKYTVELDGSFTFPLIGRVKAGGLTIRDFETQLKTRLADGFFRNPQVTVSIETYRSQRVFVTGEVRTPGAYPLTGDMTLIEVLAKAGSTTQLASDEVLIVHGGPRGEQATVAAGQPLPAGRETLRVNLKELQSGNTVNLDLRDGDTIYVARAELVYVFGQVKTPGSYSINTDTTVLQALSLAGGVTPQGAINRMRVIRVVNGETSETRVELTDLVKPGDTLVVPERFF